MLALLAIAVVTATTSAHFACLSVDPSNAAHIGEMMHAANGGAPVTVNSIVDRPMPVCVHKRFADRLLV